MYGGIKLIADILIASAALGFLVADIRQAWKLYKNKRCNTKAISRIHWQLKILSLILVMAGYTMLGLYFALSIAFGQLGLSIYVVKRIGWGNKK
jgi:hypothetical protein